MKKIISLLLVLAMSVSLVACSSAGTAGGDAAGDNAAVSTENTDATAYKIGIVTGTVSQGEEEYQAAQNLKAKYGDMLALLSIS